MQFTNMQGLSASWFSALTTDTYVKVGKYSCTGLIKPPRIHFLETRHDSEIVVDCTDRIWILLGNACHHILEEHTQDTQLSEQRISFDIDGIEVSMQPDSCELVDNGHGGKTMNDYKITSVYKYLKGIKQFPYDYFWQGNIYGYGMRNHFGLDINKIFFEMLLKDWSRSEYFQQMGQGYPKFPIARLECPVVGDKEVEDFLHKRVALFEACEHLADNDLPECTAEERWAIPDYFKVWGFDKNGVKSSKSLKNCKTRAEAEAVKLTKEGNVTAKNKNVKFSVEYVQGKSNRCEGYCPAHVFCNQYRTKINPAF